MVGERERQRAGEREKGREGREEKREGRKGKGEEDYIFQYHQQEVKIDKLRKTV